MKLPADIRRERETGAEAALRWAAARVVRRLTAARLRVHDDSGDILLTPAQVDELVQEIAEGDAGGIVRRAPA